MKLRAVTLKNFCSYGAEPVTVQFSDGLTALTGKVGDGKSTIFRGVMWALYGDRDGRTLNELVHTGQREMSVQIEFSHGGKAWLVRRRTTLSQSGDRATSHLTFGGPGPGADLSDATIGSTQELIEELLGPAEVAYATWYLAQGQASRLFDAPPFQRREILGDALGLGPKWDAAHSAAATLLKSAETYAQVLSGKEDQLQLQVGDEGELRADLSTAEQRLAEIDASVGVAEQAAIQAAAGVAAVIGRATLRTELAQERAHFENLLSSLSASLAGAFEQIKAAESYEKRAARIELAYNADIDAEAKYRQAQHEFGAKVGAWARKAGDLREMLAAWNAAESQQQRANAAAVEFQRQINELSGDVCPTCGQEVVDRDLLDAKAAELMRKVDEQKAIFGAVEFPERSREDIQADLDAPAEPAPVEPFTPDRHARDEYHGLEQARRSLPDLRQQVGNLQPQMDRHADELKSVDTRIAEAPEVGEDDLTEAGSQMAAAKNTLRITRESRDEAMRALERARLTLNRSLAASDGLLSLREDQGALRVRVGLLKLASEALSPSGARQLVLDTVLPQIEARSNHLLERLKPGTWLEITTERESGRETLDFHVVDEAGYRRVETLSGGQRTRVMFAVRVALSVVAAQAHGLGQLPAFFVDETFGDQDDDGRAAFIAALQELASDVEQVVAVTHDAEFLGMIDQVIRVERPDGLTTRVVT